MKLFLEEETEIAGRKRIIIIKEVSDKSQAIKDKTLKKCYLHKCFHDDDINKSCIREAI